MTKNREKTDMSLLMFIQVIKYNYYIKIWDKIAIWRVYLGNQYKERESRFLMRSALVINSYIILLFSSVPFKCNCIFAVKNRLIY